MVTKCEQRRLFVSASNVTFLLLVLSSNSSMLINANPSDMLQKASSMFRKHVTLSGRIHPTSQLPAYERVGCLPAFAVTTPWGSPYMIFDRLSPSESARELGLFEFFTTGKLPDSSSSSGTDASSSDSSEHNEEATASYKDRVREYNSQSEEAQSREAELEYEQTKQSFRTRTTALYFTDPEDALHLVDEMKQMGNGMDRADIRVMATSMARAVRHASRLGRGVPTGQPVDALTGRLDNSAIRYKIVPSKRELYYAATRCMGKERVGLFGDTREDDARSVLLSPRELQESKKGIQKAMPKKKGKESLVRKQWRHMRGKTAVPVFYADGMKRKVSGKDEIPLFLSYEDLMSSWQTMKASTATTPISNKPPMVEVFNFLDVLVAMDKNQWKKRTALEGALKQQSFWQRNILPSVLLRSKLKDVPMIGDDDMDKLVFVPSSRAIRFTNHITKYGNGKARLRPMR